MVTYYGASSLDKVHTSKSDKPDIAPEAHPDLHEPEQELSTSCWGSISEEGCPTVFVGATKGFSLKLCVEKPLRTHVTIAFSDKTRVAMSSVIPDSHVVMGHSGHRMGNTTVSTLPLPSFDGSTFDLIY